MHPSNGEFSQTTTLALSYVSRHWDLRDGDSILTPEQGHKFGIVELTSYSCKQLVISTWMHLSKFSIMHRCFSTTKKCRDGWKMAKMTPSKSLFGNGWTVII